jgi:hypothetical protein
MATSCGEHLQSFTMVCRHLVEDRSKEWVPVPDGEWEEIQVEDEAILPEAPPNCTYAASASRTSSRIFERRTWPSSARIVPER